MCFKWISIVLIILGVFSCGRDDIDEQIVPFDEANDLMIPPLIDSRNGTIELNMVHGAHEFFDGVKSKTMGFNGGYLGPTIRMYKDEPTHIIFTNSIGEATNVHGHGLHVPGNLDGGPQLSIQPGEKWDVILPIKQEASTNWYHPHLMGTTAEHVHAGLVGFYLIEDDNSSSLGIPKTYGVDDIPLAIQDRTFVDKRMVDYPKGRTDDLREQTLVVNGTIDPYYKVPRGNVRLRLLNASNARSYEFFLNDNIPFYKIATEGGFLDSPVRLTKLTLSPGERSEIVVDMRQGDIELMASFLARNLRDGVTGQSRVLYLQVDESIKPINTDLAQTLNSITRYDEKDVVHSRNFRINNGTINGAPTDLDVINERVTKGVLEKWTISSGRHPFHMHGASFLILSTNGNPPSPEDRGWKDTYMPNGNGELLIRFDYEAPDQFPYMYHCHILEHEDNGMMGQFTVK